MISPIQYIWKRQGCRQKIYSKDSGTDHPPSARRLVHVPRSISLFTLPFPRSRTAAINTAATTVCGSRTPPFHQVLVSFRTNDFISIHPVRPVRHVR
jgi:hypothetical protein